jgi:F-type H+-transporting ATPase subunit b
LKQISFFAILLSAVFADAASGGHGGHHEGIPWTTISYQALNVGMIVIGLVYFLRKNIQAFFKDKNTTYRAAAEKAENTRKAAERERQEMQVRLQKLEGSTEESIARARAEAADLRKQLVADAEAASKRIKEEAKASAELEVTKAKNQLRDYLIRQSLEATRGQLANKITAEDHQRLQSDFVNNVQGAQK